MKIVGRDILEDGCRAHPDARSRIEAWICEVEEAEWKTSHNITERFSNVSFIGGKRVVFNIKGNNYRFDVIIDYLGGYVQVQRFGTHDEYNNWKF